MTNHVVPCFSQILDVNDKVWKHCSGGIVSLAMVISHHKPRIHKSVIDYLITEGLKRDHFIPGVGWKHGGLIDLANSFNFAGRYFDFQEEPGQRALKKLVSLLQHGPIIASIHQDFDVKNSAGQLVVVKGIDDKSHKNKRFISINNPSASNRKAVPRVIDMGAFANGWKKRFLVILPRSRANCLNT